MDKWPLGVFASIDAGLGVKLEVAHELSVPTIQLHAPHRTTRTKRHAEQFLARLAELGIRISVVFGGFEGESYADIPTVSRTVGLVPPATRAARMTEMQEIFGFRPAAGCRRGRPAHRVCAARRGRSAARPGGGRHAPTV